MDSSQVVRGLLFCPVMLALMHAATGAELSVGSAQAGPGSSVSIPIAYTPDPGDGYLGGVQFDLEYDSSGATVVAILGDAARAAGKSLYFSDISPNDRRFVVIGPNQNPIPAGSVVTLIVNLDSNAPQGAYRLAISNLISTTPSGSQPEITGSDGSVLVQGASGSRIQAAGVLNAASLTPGPVAPGEIVTLLGSAIGPPIALVPASAVTSTLLGGTSVYFDRNPAPLLYAGPDQINAVIPYEISGQNSTQISIMSGGELLASFALPVNPSAPAIFTLDSSGAGPGAILNQDYSVNSPSNPAAPGSVVSLFATGAGMMNPNPLDGQVVGDNPPLTALAVSVKIGGASAQVLYSGAAPGLVAGVLQVNCLIPQDVLPGDGIPVELTVGAASSPAGVTIAVQ